MSESEAGVTTNSIHFGMPQKLPVIQDMHLAYNADGTAIYRPVSGNSPPYHHGDSGNGGGGSGHGMNSDMNMGGLEPLKKKRGRPRKYGPDGTLSPSPQPPLTVPHTSGAFSPPPLQQTPMNLDQAPAPPNSGGPASPQPSVKKARGRPRGSRNRPGLGARPRGRGRGRGSGGVGFTPLVITVKAGEDIASMVMSFSQNGPRAICILSANGAISNVTLRQAATSGGAVSYEGRFEILSLSGSFLVSDIGGQRSRAGGLSVSLAGPDGRVLGGGVAGPLIAATPVQVVAGSFMPGKKKDDKAAHEMEPQSATHKTGPDSGGTGASSPPSHGTLSGSSGGDGSPLNQSTGACNNTATPLGMFGMPWK